MYADGFDLGGQTMVAALGVDDEPFGALDAQTRQTMQDFLLALWRRTGATILMVTHDVEEAVYLSERVYVLAARPGRVVEVVNIPFGGSRGPSIKRDRRFLNVRDELADLLLVGSRREAHPLCRLNVDASDFSMWCRSDPSILPPRR